MTRSVVFLLADSLKDSLQKPTQVLCDTLDCEHKTLTLKDLTVDNTVATSTFNRSSVAIVFTASRDYDQWKALSYIEHRHRVQQTDGQRAITLVLSPQQISNLPETPICDFFTYAVDGDKVTVTPHQLTPGQLPLLNTQSSLLIEIINILLQTLTRQPMDETQVTRFMQLLAKARSEVSSEDEVFNSLNSARKLLPEVFTNERLCELVSIFRDKKRWDDIVVLCQESIDRGGVNLSPKAKYYWAVARNSRNQGNDRDQALKLCDELLTLLENEDREGAAPSFEQLQFKKDVFGVQGRIFKDRFKESLLNDEVPVDNSLCDSAVAAYKRIIEIEKEESRRRETRDFYGTINVVTLLFCRGGTFDKKTKQEILNYSGDIVGQGTLDSNEYWDLATFFEASLVSYFTSDSDAACNTALEALEKMHTVRKFEPWYADTTMKNINMIVNVHKKRRNLPKLPSRRLRFWLEFYDHCANATPEVPHGVGETMVANRWVVLFRDSRTMRGAYGQPHYYGEPFEVFFTSENCNHFKLLEVESKDSRAIDVSVGDIVSIERPDGWDERNDIHVLARALDFTYNKTRFRLTFPSKAHRRIFLEKCEEGGFHPFTAQLGSDHEHIEFEFELQKNQKVELGKGSFAVVYKGFNKQDPSQQYAIKRFLSGGSNSVIEMEKDFSKLTLDHKNLVRIFDFQIDNDGYKNLIMEFVDGGTLSSLLTLYGPLEKDLNQVEFFAKQLLEGLSYLHSVSFIHRDLKGENMLINTYTGVLKIADFNVSSRAARAGENSIGTVTGTPGYMAPEVGRQAKAWQSDIWSFGCCLVEMLKGGFPYQISQEELMALSQIDLLFEPEMEDNWSEDIKKILALCFKFEWEERPPAKKLIEMSFGCKPLQHHDGDGEQPYRTVLESRITEKMLKWFQDDDLVHAWTATVSDYAMLPRSREELVTELINIIISRLRKDAPSEDDPGTKGAPIAPFADLVQHFVEAWLANEGESGNLKSYLTDVLLSPLQFKTDGENRHFRTQFLRRYDIRSYSVFHIRKRLQQIIDDILEAVTNSLNALAAKQKASADTSNPAKTAKLVVKGDTTRAVMSTNSTSPSVAQDGAVAALPQIFTSPLIARGSASEGATPLHTAALLLAQFESTIPHMQQMLYQAATEQGTATESMKELNGRVKELSHTVQELKAQNTELERKVLTLSPQKEAQQITNSASDGGSAEFEELLAFVKAAGFDDGEAGETARTLLAHRCTVENLRFFSKDDLKETGLLIGLRARLWRHIASHFHLDP